MNPDTRTMLIDFANGTLFFVLVICAVAIVAALACLATKLFSDFVGYLFDSPPKIIDQDENFLKKLKVKL